MRITFRLLSTFWGVALLAVAGCATAPPDVGSGPVETITVIAPVAVSGPEQAVRPPAIRLLEAHRLSIHARDTDLATLLLDLGEKSPFDVIVDPAITGTVNAHLTNVSLLDVLERLVRGRGFQYDVSGNLIHIRPDDPGTRNYRVSPASIAEDVGFWPELQRTLATIVSRNGENHGSSAQSTDTTIGTTRDARNSRKPRKLIVSRAFHLISVTAEQPVLQQIDDYLVEVERSTGREFGHREPLPWWTRSGPIPTARAGATAPAADGSSPAIARTDRWRQMERSAEEFAAGLSAHEHGELDVAIEAYEAALQLDPQFVEAMVNLARVHADLHDLDRAGVMLERAAQLRPEYFAIYKSIGLVAVRRGDVPGVINALSRAIALQPDDVNALSNLGAALILEGRLDEATHWLYEAQRIDPGHLESTLNLALAHDRASQPMRAAAYYRRFLEMSIGEDPVRGAVRERLDELGPVGIPAVSTPRTAALHPLR